MRVAIGLSALLVAACGSQRHAVTPVDPATDTVGAIVRIMVSDRTIPAGTFLVVDRASFMGVGGFDSRDLQRLVRALGGRGTVGVPTHDGGCRLSQRECLAAFMRLYRHNGSSLEVGIEVAPPGLERPGGRMTVYHLQREADSIVVVMTSGVVSGGGPGL